MELFTSFKVFNDVVIYVTAKCIRELQLFVCIRVVKCYYGEILLAAILLLPKKYSHYVDFFCLLWCD